MTGSVEASAGTPSRQDPEFDFVVDCIDSIAPKLVLISVAHRAGIRVVSSMGAGTSLRGPTDFDIFTSNSFRASLVQAAVWTLPEYGWSMSSLHITTPLQPTSDKDCARLESMVLRSPLMHVQFHHMIGRGLLDQPTCQESHPVVVEASWQCGAMNLRHAPALH